LDYIVSPIGIIFKKKSIKNASETLGIFVGVNKSELSAGIEK
jgi:hypothetical protein